MGHYLSEMSDYDPGPPPPYVRVAIDDKPRRSRGSNSGLGSYTEETTGVEYAIDYDTYDSSTRYERPKPGDPENWQYKPERQFLHGPWDDTEDAMKRFLEHAISVIKMHGDQGRTKRPGRVIRRTVTYGPWEILDETGETQEGWY